MDGELVAAAQEGQQSHLALEKMAHLEVRTTEVEKCG